MNQKIVLQIFHFKSSNGAIVGQMGQKMKGERKGAFYELSNGVKMAKKTKVNNNKRTKLGPK